MTRPLDTAQPGARRSEVRQNEAEPCYECGSTERMGTACKPCNPEITDPSFGQNEAEQALREKVARIGWPAAFRVLGRENDRQTALNRAGLILQALSQHPVKI